MHDAERGAALEPLCKIRVWVFGLFLVRSDQMFAKRFCERRHGGVESAECESSCVRQFGGFEPVRLWDSEPCSAWCQEVRAIANCLLEGLKQPVPQLCMHVGPGQLFGLGFSFPPDIRRCPAPCVLLCRLEAAL